ncbi:uncharacterized protein C2845_PM11G15240 [Panicum miliaceum]|uniref:Reverse transcriptase domain-containing protein n=1 Tax=Panicum miliaceum TaxID=4540 RepID=A0A3L6RPM7_PANMI|nr:uncharacterized protein C2845_PM11G15240 [Panicum miliaceum]
MRGIYMLEVTDDCACQATDDDEVEISLSALTGVQNGSTFSLATTVSDSTIPALVDSGSTHCFIATTTAARVGLHPVPRPGLSVAVANGEQVPVSGVCRATPVRIGDDMFFIDIYVIPLARHQMVLGCQWLHTLGPILWDFQLKSMTFWNGNHHVKWFGTGASPSVHAATMASKDVLNLLLLDIQDVFAKPTGLPPQRNLDHRIHLLPDTAPVVVRPYRYPQLLKDEIEQQCSEMLQQGIIRPSTAAFSSPVLLVRKKDNVWCFCVDYRALNSKTVCDVFPIPVVDELLDELHGAKLFTKLDLRSGYHQVRMHPDDVAKTAFRTHHDHFEFLVMPFGLTNAPSTFQALMNEVLRPYVGLFLCFLMIY